ncbi:MAG: molybdenum-pterin-binding protein [Actinobacteria bacterium HGW-Actinobacteria-1]|jgi:molybdopterin-binding protein|nr:MAG: molybdenum-pterin-binding protein [Actinobacteria bacterium HGW-Actinobacteria-1]
MRLSARNVLKGKVVEIEQGSVNAVVKVDIGGPVVSSMVTLDALKDLGLAVGSEAYLVVKASNVILGVD